MIHNKSKVYVAVKNKHYLYFEHAFSEDPLGHCVQVSLKTSQYSTRSNGSCKNRNTIFLANSQFLITSSRSMSISVISSWISYFHWEQTRSSWPTFHVEDLYWWYQLGFWPIALGMASVQSIHYISLNNNDLIQMCNLELAELFLFPSGKVQFYCSNLECLWKKHGAIDLNCGSPS